MDIRHKGIIRLGLAPTRRLLTTPTAFNKEEAARVKREIENHLAGYENLELVNLDMLNDEGLVYDPADVPRAAKYLLEQGIDALFVPHCNFGCEEAVAKLCSAVGKPVLLWGPRDEAPDEQGNRLRDTQCGLFAVGKVLRQFGVRFTYIQNCAIEHEAFRRGFDNFIRATCIVKQMRGLRIGQLSTRPGAFWSVKANELELLERFGIEVMPVTMADLTNMLQDLECDIVQAEVENLMQRFRSNGFEKEDFEKLARLKLAIRGWCEREGLSAVAAQCWKPIDSIAGVAPCFVFSELTGEGIPVICEGDIHGAVSSVMALAATRYEARSFLADLTIRHPQDDNTELLWHCGVFPHCLARETGEATGHITCHFNRRIPAVGSWELRHGPVTLVRFDGMGGEYSVLTCEGTGVDGPATFGTYLWVEFKDWATIERKIVEGPYIHHCAAVHGHFAPAIYEALKYLPGIRPDPVQPGEAEILEYLK